jgi:arginase
LSHKSILTTIVGVPIDCAGRFTGVERMPAALRAAGLVDHLNIDDAGDLPVTIDTSERDPITGIIGFHQVCQTSETIRLEMGKLLRRGERPLVVGGCCTLLIGVIAALRQEYEPVGLAFVDGHLDFYDSESSPTGETADMELAILTGFGPSGLVDIAGVPPMIAPSDIIVMGFRDTEQAIADGAPNPAKLVPEMKLFDVQAVRRLGGAKLGQEAAKQFEVKPQRFWLHLDLDVLDQDVLPAVDYRMPNGLSWDEVAELVHPLIQSAGLIGVDVTIFNPVLDADGYYAKQIVGFLTNILQP